MRKNVCKSVNLVLKSGGKSDEKLVITINKYFLKKVVKIATT